MTADSSYSLEALERRWQLDKTPQVGLRLAEEYRRSADFDSAIVTLASGLEVYPTHTSTRVALSRYLVDAGRFSEAVPHLEQIVSLDPAHLVANKLLVGAYAGVGRVDEARDKLAIYEMMGEGDADIERLRELIETASAEPAAADDPFETQAAVDSDPGFVPLAETPDAPAEPEAEADADRGSASQGTGDHRDLTAELASGVRGEGAGQTAEATPVEEPAAAAVEPPPREVAAGFEEPFGTAFEAVSTSNYWEGVADEGIFSLEADSVLAPAAPAAGEDRERNPPSASPVFEDAVEAFSVAPPAASTSLDANSDADTVVGSTVTLAKLYLEQGHRDKAIEVLHEVLKLDPDNQEARRELELIETAAGVESDGVSSPVQRRRAILTAYRTRLRRAVAAGL